MAANKKSIERSLREAETELVGDDLNKSIGTGVAGRAISQRLVSEISRIVMVSLEECTNEI